MGHYGSRVPLILLTAGAMFTAGGCSAGGGSGQADASSMEAETGASVVGERLSSVRLLDREGESVRLSSLYEQRPLVVTFYRGGWCPYCEQALTEWQGKLDEVSDAGAMFIAITPEGPGHVSNTVAEHGLGFEVYSDARGEAARAFGVGFDLDAGTEERYRGYGIDLEAQNATGEWSLVHPMTFIVDRRGRVRSAAGTTDYVEGRADPDEVIATLERMRPML